jgi:hypothetical protein
MPTTAIPKVLAQSKNAAAKTAMAIATADALQNAANKR